MINTKLANMRDEKSLPVSINQYHNGDIMKKVTACIVGTLLWATASFVAQAEDYSDHPESPIKLEGPSKAPRAGQKRERWNDYGLDDKFRRSRTVSSLPITIALVDIASLSKLPVGIEYSRLTDVEHPEKVTIPPPSTLREYLDSITQQSSHYTWKVSSGVITFFPRAALVNESASILNQRLDNFSPQRLSIHEAFELLLTATKNPSFRQSVKIGKSRKRRWEKSKLDFTLITIVAKNLTVRDYLDEMIRQDGLHNWGLSYVKLENKKVPLLHILERTNTSRVISERTGKRKQRENFKKKR